VGLNASLKISFLIFCSTKVNLGDLPKNEKLWQKWSCSTSQQAVCLMVSSCMYQALGICPNELIN
jgi:hypothetical protein